MKNINFKRNEFMSTESNKMPYYIWLFRYHRPIKHLMESKNYLQIMRSSSKCFVYKNFTLHFNYGKAIYAKTVHEWCVVDKFSRIFRCIIRRRLENPLHQIPYIRPNTSFQLGKFTTPSDSVRKAQYLTSVRQIYGSNIIPNSLWSEVTLTTIEYT